MHILLIILLVIGGIIALLLLLALFMRKEHFVKRETIVNAPRQKVYDFLKLLKNQERFNKWAKADAGRKEEFRGTDGTVGYVYAWSGNKSAGQGEKEILQLVEGQRIETEIRFVKPMKLSATVVMEMETLSDTQTKVSLSNGGKLPYPLNVLIPVFEKNFAKDLDESLAKLKNILETE